jgi:hypothetical protein
MTIAEMLWGTKNYKAKIVEALIERKLKEEGEFGDFCRAYQKDEPKWAEWVKDSAMLRAEAETLWNQLLVVAEMHDEAFGVPARMTRQWQKALAGRIICAHS